MTIIAHTSKTIVVGVLILLLPTFLRAVTEPSILSISWIAIGLAIWWRIGQLKLAVSTDHVTVLNFFKTTHIPIEEAEVMVGEPEAGLFLSDSGGKLDKGGRTLYIVHGGEESERVRVGVAPRYGEELNRIHHDLVAEILKRRAA